MKASVERLRWIVAAAAVLLLIVLGGFFGYGRYRALRNWQRILNRSGLHITHETDGYTVSQSVKGRTTFLLRAAKAVQLGDNKVALHDAMLTLYAKTGNSVDHIYGKDFEYDEKTGVARALGEVLMDLQAPVSPGKSQLAGAAAADNVIHVRTSGLVYLRKLAVAATDQPVEFRYGGIQCLSKGAEFETGDDIVHLLADVRMNGELRGAAFTLNAAKADLNRQTNTIALSQPVVTRQGETARAANVVVVLRNDGSIANGQADGAVTFDKGTRHLVAAHMEGTFAGNSQPEFTRMSGGVTLSDSSRTRPMQGHAQQVETHYNAAGAPVSIIGGGSAALSMTSLPLQSKPSAPSLARTLRGDRIEAALVAPAHGTSSTLREVRVSGSAMATGDSVSAAKKAGDPRVTKATQISADNLDGVFSAGTTRSPTLQRLTGNGHTRMVQTTSSGERQEASGDQLAVDFAAPTPGSTGLNIVSAQQNGSVHIHSVAAPRSAGTPPAISDASADKATFDAVTDLLTLTGQAKFSQAGTALQASSIAVEQHLGDVDARGDVVATLQQESTGAASPESTTHVTADHAHLAHAAEVAEFFGNSVNPVRLWQDASQVTAARLLLDQKKHSLAARPDVPGGLVHATFASGSSSSSKTASASATGSASRAGVVNRGSKPSSAGQVLHVTSALMDYDDITREGVFAGGVRMDGTAGTTRSSRAVVFLTAAKSNPSQKSGASATPTTDPLQTGNTPASPTPFGGSLDHVVLTGEVRLDQPGRTGFGDELMYTAADSSYVLTGTPAKPAHVVDAQQGNVTGATLLFKKDDNTIIVAGAPAAAGKHGRVRSETEVSH